MSDAVPGNPTRIRELAAHWHQQGKAASAAASTLRRSQRDIEGGTLRLKGTYAAGVGDAIGDLPGELDKLSRGYKGCSSALGAFAKSLEQAQANAKRAQDDFDVATARVRSAERELDGWKPGWEHWPFTYSGAWLRDRALEEEFPDVAEQVKRAYSRRDSGKDAQSAATSLLEQAAELRRTAEKTCEDAIDRTLEDSGLKDKTWFQKAGKYLKDSFTTWDGFVRFCEAASMVLTVAAIFISGPFALVIAGVLLAMAAVAMADKIDKFRRGEIGWKELAFEAAMVLASRVGGRLALKGLRKFQNTKAVTAFSDRMHKRAEDFMEERKWGDTARNRAHKGICTVTGHPIDVATGKLFTSFVDLTLDGPLPLRLERIWYSTSSYSGPFGHGWHAVYDTALHVSSTAVAYLTPDGRAVGLDPLDVGVSTYDRRERVDVVRTESGYELTDTGGVRWSYAPRAGGAEAAGDVVVHRLREVSSRAGHRISLGYDGDDRLVSLLDSSDRLVRFVLDDAGRVAAVETPDPHDASARLVMARYAYSEAGDLVTFTDALGHEFAYRYENHLLVEETDRVGLRFHFAFDGATPAARCVRTWGEGAGHERLYERTFTYAGDVTTVVDSLGFATVHEQEGGLVVRTVDALAGVTRFEHEDLQLVRRTDPLGRTTTFDYDARGNMVLVEAADGTTVTSVYDGRDLPVEAVDALGGRWSWTHDDAGLLTARTDPLGRTTSYTYTTAGAGRLLTAITDPAGGTTDLGYDGQRALVLAATPDGAQRIWRRDGLGQIVGSLDPLGAEQQLSLDAAGQVVRVEEPDGNVRTVEYDGEGNLTRLVDVLYDVTLTYCGMGKVATRTQAGTTVALEYDSEEQLVGVVNQHGHRYSYGYDGLGNVISERGFDGVLRLFERDAAGRVATVHRPGGVTNRLTWDAVDRLLAVGYSDGSGDVFGYRADGALLRAERSVFRAGEPVTVGVEFERDALGRVVRETSLLPGQGPHWVAGAYDALGARVRVSSSLGLDQTIVRNAVGDAVGMDATAGGASYATAITRDLLGQEVARTLPGGVSSSWQRDAIGRPTGQAIAGPGGVLRERAYEWQAGDRLVGIVDSQTGPIRYAHDGLGQLVSATYASGRIELRMPDAVGNLFRTADRSDRTYSASGQVLTATADDGRGWVYAYDPEGNLIRKESDRGETWLYRWDANGMLAEVERPDGQVVSFLYDALARRVRKTFRGVSTFWVWDGDNAVHEWREVAAPAETVAVLPDGRLPAEPAVEANPDRGPPPVQPITWLFDPESFTPAARLDAGGCSAAVGGLLGEPIAWTTADGTADTVEWTTYGVVATAEAPATVSSGVLSPWRWAGQYEDDETGLYYNRHRYYDPDTGTYTSQDPIRLAGGLAVGGYVGDPTTVLDALGLSGQKQASCFEEAANTRIPGHNACTVSSLISHDKRLVAQAKHAGKSVQKGIDSLTAQLQAGNLNPGIGSKKLFGEISYARSRDGARVFFRVSGDQVEILAKASKENEDRVISLLREIHGE